MTPRPWRLENYDPTGDRPPASAAAGSAPDLAQLEVSVEEVRLEAFDKGYKAGWEDADTAHQQDQSRITADFARHLQDLSFTYDEARQATMKDTELLFRGMLESVLPKSLPDLLAATVLERVMEGVDAASQPAIEVTVAPDNIDRVRSMTEGATTPPLRICPEPSLGPGQAYLKFESREERVDLEEVLQELETIVTDLFAQSPSQEDSTDAG